jgi:hypothetical protein
MEKKRTLKMSENRVLRRILGLKGQEVKGGLRTLCNEELQIFCPSANITQVKANDGKQYKYMRDTRNVYISVGKPEGAVSLGRP